MPRLQPFPFSSWPVLFVSFLLTASAACRQASSESRPPPPASDNKPSPTAEESPLAEEAPDGAAEELVPAPADDATLLPEDDGTAEPPASPDDPAENGLPDELLPVVAAAANGPDLHGVRLYGHQWTIRQASVVPTADGLLVTGTIVRHIPFSPGEQIRYEFSFAKGKVSESLISMKDGGWTPLLEKAGPLIGILSGLASIPLTGDDITGIIARIEEAMKDGGWEITGKALATTIALELYRMNR